MICFDIKTKLQNFARSRQTICLEWNSCRNLSVIHKFQMIKSRIFTFSITKDNIANDWYESIIIFNTFPAILTQDAIVIVLHLITKHFDLNVFCTTGHRIFNSQFTAHILTHDSTIISGSRFI